MIERINVSINTTKIYNASLEAQMVSIVFMDAGVQGSAPAVGLRAVAARHGRAARGLHPHGRARPHLSASPSAVVTAPPPFPPLACFACSTLCTQCGKL